MNSDWASNKKVGRVGAKMDAFKYSFGAENANSEYSFKSSIKGNIKSIIPRPPLHSIDNSDDGSLLPVPPLGKSGKSGTHTCTSDDDGDTLGEINGLVDDLSPTVQIRKQQELQSMAMTMAAGQNIPLDLPHNLLDDMVSWHDLDELDSYSCTTNTTSLLGDAIIDTNSTMSGESRSMAAVSQAFMAMEPDAEDLFCIDEQGQGPYLNVFSPSTNYKKNKIGYGFCSSEDLVAISRKPLIVPFEEESPARELDFYNGVHIVPPRVANTSPSACTPAAVAPSNAPAPRTNHHRSALQTALANAQANAQQTAAELDSVPKCEQKPKPRMFKVFMAALFPPKARGRRGGGFSNMGHSRFRHTMPASSSS
jgi:hypothetical protein